MNNFRKFAGCMVLLVGFLVAFSAGCGKEADQSTPESTVRSFFEAMMEGDGDRAAACVSGDDQAKDFVRGMAEFTGAMQDFEKAVKAEWGDEGWAHFSGSDESMDMEANIEELDDADVRVEGDKAYVNMDDDKFVLVKKAGRWFIDTEDDSTDFPSGPEAQEGVEMFTKLAEMVREKQDRIGAEGVTAESLSQEFAMGMMATMMGGMQPPNSR